MRPSRLPRLFQSIALATLAGGAAACSSSAATIDARRFTQSICTGGKYEKMTGLKPGKGVDFVELRVTSSSGTGYVSRVESAEGTACATATDQAGCQSKLAAIYAAHEVADPSRPHTPGPGWGSSGESGGGARGMAMPTARFVVYTRGDEVKAIDSLSELTTFLAPIDTIKEAALLVTERGHRVDCAGSVVTLSSGFDVLTMTGYACGAGTQIDRNVVRVAADGTVTIIESELVQKGDSNCAIGRRPEGLVAHAIVGEDLGTFFAKMAHLEAASVPAFERLAAELRAHGAPRRLVEAAERSARDEVRHAKMIGALAKRHGGVITEPEVATLPIRSLEEVAIENATEGCVRETFGALVATYQSHAARDPHIAKIMHTIARDETRHAVLSWEITLWARERLEEAARTRLDEAITVALNELRRDMTTPVCEEAMTLAGFPDRDRALEMLDAMTPALLAA